MDTAKNSSLRDKFENKISRDAQIVVGAGVGILLLFGLAAMFWPLYDDTYTLNSEEQYADNRIRVNNGNMGATPNQAQAAIPGAPAAFVNLPAPSAPLNAPLPVYTPPPVYAPPAVPEQTGGGQGINSQSNGMKGPPISAQATPPVLIKQLGMEVISAQDGGVEVTGIMGSSHAQKGGLQAGDIIIKLGTENVRNVMHFKQLMIKAPPEANIAVEVIRDGKTKRLSVMVGEGELEGVTPIVR